MYVPINKFIDDLGAEYEDEHRILFDSLEVKEIEPCRTDIYEDDVLLQVVKVYTIKIYGKREK